MLIELIQIQLKFNQKLIQKNPYFHCKLQLKIQKDKNIELFATKINLIRVVASNCNLFNINYTALLFRMKTIFLIHNIFGYLEFFFTIIL